MKERPIIFTADMIKAILDGRKTQTRIVIKPQPKGRVAWMQASNGLFLYEDWDGSSGIQRRCPYQVGDRLWIREIWRMLDKTMRLDDEVRVEYQADGQIKAYRYGDIYYNEYGIRLPIIDKAMDTGKWQSHLPHIISRSTLEITEVRAEGVQEITEKDAKAEGCWGTGVEATVADSLPLYSAVFRNLWDSSNAKRGHGWDKNDWVWPISFREID